MGAVRRPCCGRVRDMNERDLIIDDLLGLARASISSYMHCPNDHDHEGRAELMHGITYGIAMAIAVAKDGPPSGLFDPNDLVSRGRDILVDDTVQARAEELVEDLEQMLGEG
jgi:hypothetical protein